LGSGHINNLPTDERLKNYQHEPDAALEALYFQYGRYLLISSSRMGGQPANLQGIWNDELLPAWSSEVDDQHQPANELLDCRVRRPVKRRRRYGR
jgi:alpha-L-fucosidase 2